MPTRNFEPDLKVADTIRLVQENLSKRCGNTYKEKKAIPTQYKEKKGCQGKEREHGDND